eukprot:gb/GFBE01019519.1/.p1 GENE.gb/GFBE01019519.1/~~gb/GFBE01019519.1/.p1  ORF type:complete len:192 (+),score=23.31 gb/GFBE01019519.1/:1-576(+)
MPRPAYGLRVFNTFIDVFNDEHQEQRSRRSRSAPPCVHTSHEGEVAGPPRFRGVEHHERQASDEHSTHLRDARRFAPETASMEEPEHKEEQANYEHGIHPRDARWKDVYKILIKNLPARCTYQELSDFIASHAEDKEWSLQLPLTHKRNRGFAFVTLRNSSDAIDLAHSLWEGTIPFRQTTRILHVYPAAD